MSSIHTRDEDKKGIPEEALPPERKDISEGVLESPDARQVAPEVKRMIDIIRTRLDSASLVADSDRDTVIQKDVYDDLNLQPGEDPVRDMLIATVIELTKRNSELKAANAHLANLADRHALTGAISRNGYERMWREFEREYQAQKSSFPGQNRRREASPEVTQYPFELIRIDIDNFKKINDDPDGGGHKSGDDVLIGIVTRFQRRIRPGDEVIHISGDEIIIRALTKNGDPLELAESLRRELETTPIISKFMKDGAMQEKAYYVTASFGVAPFDGSRAEVEAQADLAAYKAKESGRNAVFFYDPKTKEYRKYGEKAE